MAGRQNFVDITCADHTRFVTEGAEHMELRSAPEKEREREQDIEWRSLQVYGKRGERERERRERERGAREREREDI